MIELRPDIVAVIAGFRWDDFGFDNVQATLRGEEGTSNEWVVSLAGRITAVVGPKDEAERVVWRAMEGDDDARRQVVTAWRRVYGSPPSTSEGRGRV